MSHEHDDSTAFENLAMLAYLGYTRADSLPLRVTFAASGLRQAVELAGSLREHAQAGVRIRPAALRLLTRGHWHVAFTTPPMRLDLAALRGWHGEMQALARMRPGCCFVGWTAVSCRAPG